jgi:hypothetical protein
VDGLRHRQQAEIPGVVAKNAGKSAIETRVRQVACKYSTRPNRSTVRANEHPGAALPGWQCGRRRAFRWWCFRS